jgi:hypothetical protein
MWAHFLEVQQPFCDTRRYSNTLGKEKRKREGSGSVMAVLNTAPALACFSLNFLLTHLRATLKLLV